MIRRPPRSPLFPSTPLFRSHALAESNAGVAGDHRRRPAAARRHGDRPALVVGRLDTRSEEHTSELQSQSNLVCRLLLEKKKNIYHAKSTYATCTTQVVAVTT